MIKITIRKNKLYVKVQKIEQIIEDTVYNVLGDDVGPAITQYIKYDLLNGQLVKYRTGELQRGIYFRRIGRLKIGFYIRGPHALVGKWLDEGINHTWMIPKIPSKLLRFKIEEGPDGGHWVSATQVEHPVLEARHFIAAGADAKRDWALRLLEHSIRKALRSRQG